MLRLPYDPAILDLDDPVGNFGNFKVMRDHNDCLFVFLVGDFQKRNDLITRLFIQISGRCCVVSTIIILWFILRLSTIC